MRHLDSLLGVGAPEPLARMYSRPFYRVTWIVTALDAGFASAMNVRPLWLRDIASLAFAVYYLIYANEADEKLRKYRAVCHLDMLRVTWHKTTNPYLRAFTALTWHRPKMVRTLLLPRPEVGAHARRPTQAWLFYDGTDAELRREEQLYLDIPGGGFICMTPEHHEERLRQLAKETQRPILALNYCKAPEHPFPYALEECFDVYRALHETKGKIIGMSGTSANFSVLLSGDSAGGNLAAGVTLKIIEYPQPRIRSAYARRAAGGPGSAPPPLPKPIALLLAYPSLNFAYTSWMRPDFVRVLRQQSELNLNKMGTPSQTAPTTIEGAGKGGAAGGAGSGAAAYTGTGSIGTGSSSPLNPSHQLHHRNSLPASASGSSIGGGPAPTLARRTSVSSRLRRPTSAERRRAAEEKEAARVGKEDANGFARSKRDKSYTSLAEQAQLHLAERARFAEAEPSTSDDQAGEEDDGEEGAADDKSGVWARIEGDSMDAGAHEPRGMARSASIDAAQAEHEQRQLDLQAQTQAEDARKDPRNATPAPIHTRLTMTSMAGYFQDRILTQSMLRAMAIMYIGPRKQPDFDHDYYLSPLVAPARLLAEFPPTLIICGEKDPLCDDTVVMSGKIREAKQAKLAELERRRAGKSARFGEALRMSIGGAPGAAPVERDPIEDEDPEDFAQMRIIEGWSHGFLQMSSLLPEAKSVITFLSTWAVESFDIHADYLDAQEERRQQLQPKRQIDAPPAYSAGKQAGAKGGNKLTNGRPASTDEDDDDDEPLSFVPKAQRSPTASPRPRPADSQGSPVPASGPTLRIPASYHTGPASPPSAEAAHTGGVNRRVSSPGSSPRVPSSALRRVAGEASANEAGKGNGNADSGAEMSAGATRGIRRGSGAVAPAGSAEEAYKSLLVSENKLLQRRRDEAVYGLGETASTAVSSDEEEGHEGGRPGRGRHGRGW